MPYSFSNLEAIKILAQKFVDINITYKDEKLPIFNLYQGEMALIVAKILINDCGAVYNINSSEGLNYLRKVCDYREYGLYKFIVEHSTVPIKIKNQISLLLH